MTPGIIMGFVAILFYIKYVYKDLSKHDKHSTVTIASLENSMSSVKHRRLTKEDSLRSSSDHGHTAILSSDGKDFFHFFVNHSFLIHIFYQKTSKEKLPFGKKLKVQYQVIRGMKVKFYQFWTEKLKILKKL